MELYTSPRRHRIALVIVTRRQGSPLVSLTDSLLDNLLSFRRRNPLDSQLASPRVNRRWSLRDSLLGCLRYHPRDSLTGLPTSQPTGQPTGQPTVQPTSKPTGQPTGQPTREAQPLSRRVYPRISLLDNPLGCLQVSQQDSPQVSLQGFLHGAIRYPSLLDSPRVSPRYSQPASPRVSPRYSQPASPQVSQQDSPQVGPQDSPRVNLETAVETAHGSA